MASHLHKILHWWAPVLGIGEGPDCVSTSTKRSPMGHVTVSQNAVLDRYIESKMRAASTGSGAAASVTASTHAECLAFLEEGFDLPDVFSDPEGDDPEDDVDTADDWSTDDDAHSVDGDMYNLLHLSPKPDRRAHRHAASHHGGLPPCSEAPLQGALVSLRAGIPKGRPNAKSLCEARRRFRARVEGRVHRPPADDGSDGDRQDATPTGTPGHTPHPSPRLARAGDGDAADGAMPATGGDGGVTVPAYDGCYYHNYDGDAAAAAAGDGGIGWVDHWEYDYSPENDAAEDAAEDVAEDAASGADSANTGADGAAGRPTNAATATANSSTTIAATSTAAAHHHHHHHHPGLAPTRRPAPAETGAGVLMAVGAVVGQPYLEPPPLTPTAPRTRDARPTAEGCVPPRSLQGGFVPLCVLGAGQHVGEEAELEPYATAGTYIIDFQPEPTPASTLYEYCSASWDGCFY